MNSTYICRQIKSHARLLAMIFIFVFVGTSFSEAQPVWQSASTAVGKGNQITVGPPSGLAVGDLMILGLAFEKGNSVSNINLPDGWIVIERRNQLGDVGFISAYMLATQNDLNNISFRVTASPSWSVGVSRITGFNPNTPIHVYSSRNSANSSPSVIAPSITTSIGNTLVLAFFVNNKDATYTTPSGTTKRYDAPNSQQGLPSNMMASYVQSVAGATGVKTATASEGETWVSQQIAIEPAAGPFPGIFRSRQTGNWNNPDTWEQSNGSGGWTNTSSIPQGGQTTTIRTGHIVTVTQFEEIENLTIDPEGRLVIGPTGSFTATNSLIKGQSDSDLIVESTSLGTGSFIHNGAVTGSFQRYIGNSETWQLLSSPVASQEISGDFTPSGTYGDGTGYDFYTWFEPDTAWVYLLNDTTWAKANGGSNQFIPGRGYLVSYQETGTKTFSGNFNHSQVSIPMTKSGDYVTNLDNKDYSMFSMNLAGNPYPSSIDWKAQSGWGRNDLEQTGGGYDIYIWSVSNDNNYGVYNSGSTGDFGTNGTSRYIAPNQGFFVRASGSGTLAIHTGVKSHQGSGNWINKSGSNNGGFSENTPGRLHLRIEDRNGNGADEVIIEFGHTTNTKKPGSPKLFSMIETAPSLYIPKDKKSYSIRRLKTPDQNPLLPLSFIAGTDGEYMIKAAFDFTDIDMDMVVLEDLQTKQTHDFKTQGDYIFFATVKDKAERFQIRFKEGNYANPHAQLPVSAFTHNKTLAIDLRLVDPGEKCLVELFDSLGRKVFEGSYSGNSLYEVTIDGLQGAFMVQISTRHASYGGKVMFF